MPDPIFLVVPLFYLQEESTGEITFYMKGADVAMASIVQYNDWLEEEVKARYRCCQWVSFVVGLLLEILSLGIISCFRIEILAEWRVPVLNECPLWVCLSVAILPIVFFFCCHIIKAFSSSTNWMPGGKEQHCEL